MRKKEKIKNSQRHHHRHDRVQIGREQAATFGRRGIFVRASTTFLVKLESVCVYTVFSRFDFFVLFC